MDWLGILTGFGLGCAGLALGLWAWTWAIGRLPTDRYHAHLQSPEWAALLQRIAQRRGPYCSACRTPHDLQLHHATYANLGWEQDWQVWLLCDRHHRLVHQLSRWVFASHTRGLLVTTPAVIWGTRLLGRRSRATTVRRAA